MERDQQESDPLVIDMETLERRHVPNEIDNLTFISYRHQRNMYKISAERLAKIFPVADKYEARYQRERAAAQAHADSRCSGCGTRGVVFESACPNCTRPEPAGYR